MGGVFDFLYLIFYFSYDPLASSFVPSFSRDFGGQVSSFG